MRCELPTPRRCCFCIPLRIGLLIVGYIKTIISALYLLDGSFNLYATLTHELFFEHYFILLMFLFSVFNNLVDVVFQLAFLIGAHKKDYRMIRLYYRYGIYNIIAITVLFFVNVGLYLNTLNLFFTWKYVAILALIFLWTLVIQIYLLILVRSEFLKLKDKTKFQFVNNEADAQCSANIKMSSELDEDDNDDEMDYDKISVNVIVTYIGIVNEWKDGGLHYQSYILSFNFLGIALCINFVFVRLSQFDKLLSRDKAKLDPSTICHYN